MPIERRTIVSRDEWLAWRKKDITASSVAALFDLHPYTTALSLYSRLRGADIPEQVETEVMRRGTALEPIVAEEVRRLRPEWQIEKATEYVRDTDLKLGCTPDFWFTNGKRGVLQAKTVGAQAFQRHWQDGPPFWIVLQTATEMMLENAERGAVGALIIGEYTFDTQVYEIERHTAAEKRIVDAVSEFWDRVAKSNPPTIDYGRDATLINLLYPHQIEGKVLDLRGDNYLPALLAQRERVVASMAVHDVEKKVIEAEIKAKMQDAECILCDDWTITWKVVNRRDYTVKPTTYRRLRAKRNKDNVARDC